MTKWLLKTEPEEYSYTDLERDGRGRWDGVRGIQALHNIRDMRPGDLALFYHTGKEKAIVGICEVMTLPFRDPKVDDPKLVVFDVSPRQKLTRPVTLKEVKSWPELADWELVRLPRLSVMPVSDQAWDMVLEAANRPPMA